MVLRFGVFEFQHVTYNSFLQIVADFELKIFGEYLLIFAQSEVLVDAFFLCLVDTS